MTVIAMASLRGAPGTTTAALGLAAVAATRQPALFIEADPAGGVLIGRCAGLVGAPTLEQIAFPDREAAALSFPALLERSTQRLGDLPVAVAPADPFRASASVAGHRSRWVSNVHHLDALVVIDCGRLYPGSPAATIVRQSDMLVLVCAPDGSDVVTAREWAMSQLELTGDRSVLRDPPVLLTVGSGRYRPWRLRANSATSTSAHCHTTRVPCRCSCAGARRRIAPCDGSISSAPSTRGSTRSSPTPSGCR